MLTFRYEKMVDLCDICSNNGSMTFPIEIDKERIVCNSRKHSDFIVFIFD